MKKILLICYIASCFIVLSTSVYAVNESYNVQAAVEYALTYAYNYNPNYQSYKGKGGDCANFVSQCLNAGGISTNSTWAPYTYAWLNCPSFRNYFVNELGCELIAYPDAAQVDVGDVMIYGNNSHVTLVTSKVNGVPHITGHTTDTKENPKWTQSGYWDYYAVIKLSKLGSATKKADIPVISSVTVDGTSVTVSWTATANTHYYDIYLIQEPWDWSSIKYYCQGWTASTSKTFYDIAEGDYQAFVISRPNDDTAQSNRVPFTVQKKADIPVISSVTVEDTSVTVSWTPTANTDYYDIYLIQEPWDWSSIKYYCHGWTESTSKTFYSVAEGDYQAFVIARPNDDTAQSNWMPFTVHIHKPGPAATCTVAQICTSCNLTLVDALGHNAGEEATCTTPQICTRCGIILKPVTEHSYTTGDFIDPAHPHKIYNTCSCGAKRDSGKTATVSSCDICNPFIIGDVNNDNKVNETDVTILNHYFAGWNDYSQNFLIFDAVDINKDGSFTRQDAMILSRYVNGWKDYSFYFER